MESHGVSSGSRRSAEGGDPKLDRSSWSTQGVFAAKVGDDRDGVAPKCHCGVYAILYLSKTANNPNRLFFGCPFFKKARVAHCKFFLWLDRHTEKLGMVGAERYAEENVDVDAHFAMLRVENRVIDLEDRVAAIERTTKPKLWLIVALLVWGFSLYVVGFREA
ncbi:hypothetical protein PIB30_088628 [Stylosanthes scabra]|uniref:GRF-type domain-containing protein n=1 Tax=Stylosanthes scabra TaxID=79078 RepID=A0ABU6XSU8_9FABA|nr:hypothetical protein [Stylosanthes scabra]